jgi:sugar phosphate isomerase/epimerase
MSTHPRPAIQLYSLNDSSLSVPDLIRQAGKAGYEGVEFAGRFRQTNAAAVADALEDAGVEPVACHANLSVIEAAIRGENELFEKCETVGVNKLVNPHTSTASFGSKATVETLVERYLDVARKLASREMRLVHHTSRHEFWPLLPNRMETAIGVTPVPDVFTKYLSRELTRLRRNGATRARTGFQALVEGTDATNLQFEIDVAEVTAGRFDPVESISLVSDRLPMLHLRDTEPYGRLVTYKDAKTGTGTVDFDRAIEAATEAGVEWLVYEDEIPQDTETKLSAGISFMDRMNGSSTIRSSKRVRDD